MEAIVYYGNKPCEEAAVAAWMGRVLDVLCIQFMKQEVRYKKTEHESNKDKPRESGRIHKKQEETEQARAELIQVWQQGNAKRCENEPPKLEEAAKRIIQLTTSCIWQQAPQMNDETRETERERERNKPTIIIAICALSATAMLISPSSSLLLLCLCG